MSNITKKLDAAGLSQVWSKILENFLAKNDAGVLAALDKVDSEHLSDALLSLISGKADTATTLAGYGINDAYTKTETDTRIENVVKTAVTGIYKYKGSVAFADLPTEAAEGDTYNMTDDFVTTDAFMEGAGNEYKAGTNVSWTTEGKWDCMAGIHDFSEFMMKSDLVDITEEEINAICVMPE